MFSIQIIFIDLDSEGEVCDLCKLPIENKKWVLMLDFNDPINFLPKPLPGTFCTPCKENYLVKENN